MHTLAEQVIDAQGPAPESKLPHVILAPRGSGPADLVEFVRRHRTILADELRMYGALLFRGYGATEAEHLSAVLTAAGGTSMDYLGGDSPRSSLGEGVYTSTEAPPGIRIPLHNELSYLSEFPRHLWMACGHVADEGGETILGDGQAIFLAIDRAIRERFIRDGIHYRCAFRGNTGALALLDRMFHVSKSWMDAFGTIEPRVAEARCRRVAPHTYWARHETLVFETDRPATIRHPETGAPVWFNQAHVFLLSARYLGEVRYGLARALYNDAETRPHHATYRDGSPIEKATLEHLHDVLDAHTVPVEWQRGDVLWIDNVACMHGRERFYGKRKVMIALSA
jgi:Taurine catabolism dioxygenase TauD, TfdA family